MSDPKTNPENNSKPPQDPAVKMVFLVMATIALTVLVLEYYGMIKHTQDQGGRILGTFTAHFVTPDDSFTASAKPSNLHAECVDHWLVIANDADSQLKGLLVDYRNRAVRCELAAHP